MSGQEDFLGEIREGVEIALRSIREEGNKHPGETADSDWVLIMDNPKNIQFAERNAFIQTYLLLQIIQRLDELNGNTLRDGEEERHGPI
jgi:hypothetical protein